MPPAADLITGAGTAGLIAFLLFTVWRFTTEEWTPGARANRAEQRVDILSDALAQRTEADKEMTAAFKELVAELRSEREQARVTERESLLRRAEHSRVEHPDQANQ